MRKKLKIGIAGVELIKSFESCKLTAYVCPAGVLTIGWGHTGKDVKPGLVISRAKADALFLKDIAIVEAGVNQLVTSEINQNQFDALCSFAYNCGLDIDADTMPEGLGDSTLLKLINANPDDVRIAQEFAKWNKSNRVTLSGLIRRRAAEAKLYFS